MAMSCRTNGNPGCEIQESVVIYIIDPDPLPPFRYQGVNPGVGWRYIGFILSNQAGSFRTGQLGLDLGISHHISSMIK